MTAPKMKPAPLTIPEAAERLGVEPWQVYRWIRAGQITHVRYPSREGHPSARGLRIEEDTIAAFLAAHRQEARAS